MDTRRLHDLVTELGEIEDAQAWIGTYQDTPSRVYTSWSEGASSAGYVATYIIDRFTFLLQPKKSVMRSR